MKKAAGLLLCILLAMLCAAALADAIISPDVFPDAVFRESVRQFDLDQNGRLDAGEIAKVSEIHVDALGITSLKGVEQFPALSVLTCINNSLETLDITGNPALTYVSCWGNRLTELDLSKNTALVRLGFGNNFLTSVDISSCPELILLQCSNNRLRSLDLTHNPRLENVWCDQNSLLELDVRACPILNRIVTAKKPAMHEWQMYGWWETDESGSPNPCLFLDETVRVLSGEAEEEAAEVTVSGGKYRLNAAKTAAVFTGPAKKSVKTLKISDKVRIGNQDYPVTEIKVSACKGLKKLASLTVGKNVRTIGKNAFANCAKLKKITFRGTAVSKIGKNAWKKISATAVFRCPAKKLKAYTRLIMAAGAPKKVRIRK